MNQDTSLSRRAFLEKAATITAIGFAAPHLTAAEWPAQDGEPLRGYQGITTGVPRRQQAGLSGESGDDD